MNVNLTPDLEKLVRDRVASGLYNSASEVVREGLRLLAEQDRLRDDRLQRVRKDIQDGLDQARRGELIDGDAVVAELRAVIAKYRKAKRKGA
jgi:antitoxin ParD1/3/4